MNNVFIVTNNHAKLRLLLGAAGVNPIRCMAKGCMDFNVHFAYADESDVVNRMAGVRITHLFIDEDCDEYVKKFLLARIRFPGATEAIELSRRYCVMDFDMLHVAAQMFRGKWE